jgi:osmoprotectant transport system ATP-binding protein
MAALLEFDNVSYSAAGNPVLRSVTLTVDAGETVALLGRSGSGKTTLLRTVNLLIHPDSGRILFQGRPVSDWDPIRLRRSIGYVIQDGGLFPHYTVERNVGLIPSLEGWPDDRIRSRTHELLVMVGLDPGVYASRYPRQLSGGEKQRVGIARALAVSPPLLLLDEPFAALDSLTRSDLQQQFIELTRTLHTAALFVTHDMREAEIVASRIATLTHGTLYVQ